MNYILKVSRYASWVSISKYPFLYLFPVLYITNYIHMFVSIFKSIFIYIYIYLFSMFFHAMEYAAHSRDFRSRSKRKLRPVVPACPTPTDALWLRWTVALWWRWYRWSRYGHNPRSYNHDEDGDDDPTYDDKYHGFYLIYVLSLLILCWWK